MMNTCIQSIQLEYHDPTIKLPVSIFEKEIQQQNEYQFGIIRIKMNKKERLASQIQSPIHFVFSVDISGSMCDSCIDNKTKLQHIQHTMENMLCIFAQNKNEIISIQVNTFNSQVKSIVPNTIVSESNITEMIQKIKKIYAHDSTDIEKAVTHAMDSIEDYIEEYNSFHPTTKSQIVHILLTDGHPTTGSNNPAFLKTILLPEYPNIFIGYGKDHDAHFMSELASNPKDSYVFIDALENAGLVYGEIIHNILYKVWEDVSINTSENTEIYNYKTNTWEKKLYIGDLVGEMEKIFHIRTIQPKYKNENKQNNQNNQNIINSFCILQGNIINDSNPIKREIIVKPTPTSIQNNLSKYIFRQKTQELLYEAKSHALQNIPDRNQEASQRSLQTSFFNSCEEIETENNIKEETEAQLKDKLNQYMQIMLEYMKKQQLENDPWMKMLYNDIYINYKLVGKKEWGLYSCSRQHSQGRQTTYTAILQETDTTDPDQKYHIESPYATQGVKETMESFIPLQNNTNTNTNTKIL